MTKRRAYWLVSLYVCQVIAITIFGIIQGKVLCMQVVFTPYVGSFPPDLRPIRYQFSTHCWFQQHGGKIPVTNLACITTGLRLNCPAWCSTVCGLYCVWSYHIVSIHSRISRHLLPTNWHLTKCNKQNCDSTRFQKTDLYTQKLGTYSHNLIRKPSLCKLNPHITQPVLQYLPATFTGWVVWPTQYLFIFNFESTRWSQHLECVWVVTTQAWARKTWGINANSTALHTHVLTESFYFRADLSGLLCPHTRCRAHILLTTHY